MESLSDHHDIEMAHGRADDLLIEALEWVTRDRYVKESADRLVAAYRGMVRWYA